MSQWQAEQPSGHLAFVADGNGDFTRGLGMLVKAASEGARSRRYSMLVRDGTVVHLFEEPDDNAPPTLSTADHMLHTLNPSAKPPPAICVLVKSDCPDSSRVTKLLDEHRLPYDIVEVGKDVGYRALRALSGSMATPQVFANGRCVGGLAELPSFLREFP
eukprot:NODE_2218_length_964_cov_46.804372_g1826_i0.p1 GENE.NODE_2218_length_964_cov_46.804372_g1826_i0~~NODE_2218_length_964_cov_46.804372_g1826_i0.p1  ORF type:complete len:160 (-),score=31.96 NODE_2218_length_964_cov_46.804372_g1826_i0:113-592(-)